jgi:hypothetical protein
MTLAVWMNVVGETYGICQKYKDLTQHNVAF